MRHPPDLPQLDDQQFDAIAALAYRECGLKLEHEKKLMVQSRLRHRLRALNLDSFSSYSEHIASRVGFDEHRLMISALTTNVSQFFREAHHFRLLSDRLMPLFRQRIQENERIRIWSAGCSKGQEPYSIAMHLLRSEPKLATADFKILGTDIDPSVVAQARTAQFTSLELHGVSTEDIGNFTVSCGDGQSSRRMCDDLTRIVSVNELNLFDDWPMRFAFDAIFCRNVVIYFDQSKQTQLWPRFNRALTTTGMLFLGHSERVLSPQAHGFRSVGPTTYVKCDDARVWSQ
ncbi:chemotaxis protein methyltransferase [Tateyamaria omphalii]|uniref:CheR family methyltransferase n=1 Tax=Tateyamaria omphalii TaxID=299262 RepID=UPI001676A6A4|nr:CheR family methyltransferase [Tateyamaria omphalii]GGX64321.1 chemotaxis protein methyltransferase [Tateyamaria omphalii]